MTEKRRRKGDANLFCFIPVSELAGWENHIFVAVPRAEVEQQIDWRLPVFEAGRYVIAFDGAARLPGRGQALLLLEL